MRILLVNEYFPPVAPGGAEWSVYYLAEALARRGHTVGVATVSHGPQPQTPAGVELFVMPFPFRLEPGQKMYRQGFLENPVFHFWMMLFTWRTARRFRADILHAQSKNALVASTWTSRLTGIPTAYTLRDIGIACPFGMCYINGSDIEQCSLGTCLGSCSRYLIEHYSPQRLWDRIKVRLLALGLWPDTRWKQHCLDACSLLIAPSKGLIASLPQAIRDKKWNVIPHLPPSANGSKESVTELGKSLPARFVLFLGKISPGKGIHVLEQAIRLTTTQTPGMDFVIAGKGNWTPPADVSVITLGSVNHPTALRLMKQAACIVVPSLVPEAYNRVVLEAMSQGRPVVVSDSGSLPEQVRDGETGLVVPRGDAPALARAIGRIWADPAFAQKIGERGRQNVTDQLSPEAVLSKLEQLYHITVNECLSPRWQLINRPARWGLQALVLFNDKAKRAAMWLTWLTGKSNQRVHPKNLLADDNEGYAWYGALLKPGERVLDVGSGHGTHTMIAAAHCGEAVGMEYDSGNLSTCQARAREKGIRNIQFVLGNAEERLPFKDGEFDTVLLLDVLEHLNKRDGTLGEIHRILKPAGRLLVAIPNRETSWKGRLKRAGLFYYSDRDHKIEYSLQEARHEIEKNHFRIQDPVQTVVIDTPLVGLIDLVGGLSLSLYKRLQAWKVRAAARNPQESNGFQIVAFKN